MSFNLFSRSERRGLVGAIGSTLVKVAQKQNSCLNHEWRGVSRCPKHTSSQLKLSGES